MPGPRWGVPAGAGALLGWTIGRNVRIDTRWATSNTDEVRRHAAELAALAPDVILAGGTTPAEPLLQATRTVPIVFTLGVDPVGAGFRRQLGGARRKRHRFHVVLHALMMTCNGSN
jgi:hypothetical protein